MEYIILLLIVCFLGLLLLPTKEDNNSNDLPSYKLTHCEVHEWISKSTGFDGKEFESNYLVCSKCGYNPETKTYE
jgi:hypothetical protein